MEQSYMKHFPEPYNIIRKALVTNSLHSTQQSSSPSILSFRAWQKNSNLNNKDTAGFEPQIQGDKKQSIHYT